MSSTTARDPQAQSSATATPAPGAFTPKPAFERTLVFIVVLLGIAIIGGLAAVVLRIIYLSSRPVAPEAPKAAQSLPQPAPSAVQEGLQLALPPGAVVKGTALDDNRLAVTYEGPQGTGIAVIDLGSGQTVARVRIEAK